jgi:signal transduction histidine kinase
MQTAVDAAALFRRYQALQTYVGWTDDDAQRVKAAGPLLRSHFSALIDDFYAQIERHPATRKVITGGPEQIERLKGTLREWIKELFSGTYDIAYVSRRWRVGRRHVDIGLDQVYTNMALSRLRTGIVRAVQEDWQGEPSELKATVRALNSLLDLDLATIEDAYQAEFLDRQQRVERLAIAHLSQDVQRRVTDLQTLLDVVPIGIAIAEDPACRFIRVNKSFAQLLRLPPHANASLSAPTEDRPNLKVFHDNRELSADEMPMQRAAARGEEIRDVEIDIVFPDGAVANLFGYAAPLLNEQGISRGAVGAFLNITERKNAQERLLQTERLAAIGQMVTGLAHESGNALARSQACLEMLALEVEDRPEALNLVSRVQHAQDHLQQLYEEVRGYASPLKLQRELWSVTGIWRQAWTTLELPRRGRDATFREELCGIDPDCQIDPFRMQQVFRNILENALAACKDPVLITIRCSETNLKGRPALRVTVRDNGPGLTPEQRQRIFEPFFTTKTKGTGLGMAIAQRIVEAHGGQITIGAGNVPGAEIIITLPRESR